MSVQPPVRRKVGILTYHYAYNYGAVLQAYGLLKALEKLGFDSTVLDYRAPHILSHNRPLGLRRGRFMHVIPMRWKFDRFRKQNLDLSRRLQSCQDLEKEIQDFHAIVVGSDQVWNVNVLKEVNLAYFLGLSGAFRKVSYSACIGQPVQPPACEDEVRERLKGFDAISVRNRMTSDFVKRLLGSEPAIVSDPSILHDFTEIPSPENKSEPYNFVYSIWEGKTRETLGALLKKITGKFKMPSVSVSQFFDAAHADIHLRSAGPAEWIHYLRNASFICTDSFHGVVFSIKFRKPFVVVTGNEKSGRIVHFLEQLGLENRIITPENLGKADVVLDEELDFEKIGKIMEVEINKGIDFLNDSLK